MSSNVIDPVCGMTVKPDSDHATDLDGIHYRFCSAKCKSKFDVTVCASTGFACDAETKSCVSHCSSDADCMDASMPVCNMGTGACECGSNEDCLSGGIAGQTTCTDGVCGCGSDADCVGNPGGSKCALLGFCGCGSDQECSGKPNADTCYDGACGCSSDMNCTMPLFDNTQSVCKNF